MKATSKLIYPHANDVEFSGLDDIAHLTKNHIITAYRIKELSDCDFSFLAAIGNDFKPFFVSVEIGSKLHRQFKKANGGSADMRLYNRKVNFVKMPFVGEVYA
jgi:hypothetical protein